MNREKTNIIYGLHAVQAAVQNSSDQIDRIVLLKERKDKRLSELAVLAKNKKVVCQFSMLKQLDELTESARHQGAVAILKAVSAYAEGDLPRLIKSPAFLLILDGVQDPHNLGAILRTADAVGVDAVIAPKDNAVGITPIVRKVASGAAETVPFITVTNLSRTIQMLQEKGVWVYGLDERGEATVFDLDLKGSVAIVMGAEGRGLRRLTKQHCDDLLNIPMKGSVQSLNVSVATGVVLYECLRQRHAD